MSGGGGEKVSQKYGARASRIRDSSDCPDRRRRLRKREKDRAAASQVPTVSSSSFTSSSTSEEPTRFYFILLCESPSTHTLPLNGKGKDGHAEKRNMTKEKGKRTEPYRFYFPFLLSIGTKRFQRDSCDNRLTGVDSSDFQISWSRSGPNKKEMLTSLKGRIESLNVF